MDLRDKVVSRPSSRRDAAGFNRYVAQLDEMMTRDVRDYITALRSDNVKESLSVMQEQELKPFVLSKQKLERVKVAGMKKEADALKKARVMKKMAK